jgi:hypothetical protein
MKPRQQKPWIVALLGCCQLAFERNALLRLMYIFYMIFKLAIAIRYLLVTTYAPPGTFLSKRVRKTV